MGYVFVPSNMLGALFMSTMQGHICHQKIHCVEHCVQCEAVDWLADNAPAMIDVAVRKGADIQDWQWQHSDGTVDWKSVKAMFSTPEECLHNDHHHNDNPPSHPSEPDS